MNFFNKTQLVAGVALMSLGSIASAITQVVPFGPTTPSFDTPLTFNQYNGNIGDVVSIEIIIDMDISGGELIADNDGVSSGTVDFELGVSTDLTSTDVTLLTAGFTPISTGQVTSNIENNRPIAGNIDSGIDPQESPSVFHNEGDADNETFTGSNKSTQDSGFVGNAFWAGFVGAGTYDIHVDATSIVDISGPGIAGAFTPVSSSGTVTVIYTVVPEPATSALFIGLLTGVLLLIRKRARSK